jgi:segregation and condensation protein A
MTSILRQLQHRQFMEFGEMFNELIEDGKGKAILVVNFIAMLELSRESLVEITQAEPYAPIYVRLNYQPQ